MKIFKKLLSYNTKSKNEIITISNDISSAIKASKIKNGTLIAYSLHTTLALFIQETNEPNLCSDIINQLEKIVDNNPQHYTHSCSGNKDKGFCSENANGPSHIRQMLTNQNIVLDITDSKLNLGPWQDIALLELDGPRQNRQVVVKVTED